MEDCLCIGIDFGTTFSGVAWAFSRYPDDIKVVTKWRADLAHNSDDAKCPTEIVYDANKNLRAWGYEIRPNESPLKWFKLLLVDEKDLEPDRRNSPQLIEAKQMLHRLRMTAVDAVGDYLRELWKHTIESIEREFGQSAVRGLPFRVVVTVPAIWKPYAQQRTREAVHKAGILKGRLCGETILHLVPEPEAAALATLAEFRGRPGVKPGDVFVVCDAGGGTVDITSYKVQKTDPVVVKECVQGDGKMCGAIFVDQEFQNFLRGKLTKRWDKISASQIKKLMNDEWEHGIKRGFEDTDREWEVRLPPEATSSSLILGRKKGEGATLKLQKGHVRGIFSLALGQIRALVHKQIAEIQKKEKKAPKCIMLVGGFGRCTYLYKVFNSEYSNQEIEVLQPSGNNPWTAICRGAVIKAMSSTGQEGPAGVHVSTRVSRFNYGIETYENFVEGFHEPYDMGYVESEGGWFAVNQMRWYLRKGTDISSQEPIRLQYARVFQRPSELACNQFSISLNHSETQDPPIRKTGEVLRLCDITVRLETPFEKLPIYINRLGHHCRKIAFEIEMTSSGGSLDFVAYIDGKKQGQRNVNVMYG
ncbi:actin-like ATPase domain-containing protein [Cenococcum geophilum 1.58]|uniref:actin-like ATPase domain-containing protein n=1 Tax=Cenococcum geophilum 1.58 TaxID=794803 RepID=UPI00358FD413|nr:actin-like ATPase domain-containing protein [Cenococcum geophilum 1.58]